MCIFVQFLFTLVEWLSFIKEYKCFNYWIIDSTPPPPPNYLGRLLFLIIGIKDVFYGKERFAALRKDIKDGSLQVGKDYWESIDWNPTCPTLAEWSKRQVEVLIKEKKRDSYWGEWHTLPRERN